MISYVIITPVRDEARFLPATLTSVMAQTVRPREWQIIDDGSTDSTGALLDKHAAECPWTHVTHRQNRGFRLNGSGVMEAFNEGLRAVQTSDWEFIVKLDGDLQFDANFFARCFAAFSSDPKLGIAGATLYNVVDGQREVEKTPRFHVRGATKIYRRACWNDIGGLVSTPGWDTIDEAKANMMGWTTRSLPEVFALHLRPTGAAEGTWRDSVKGGRARYFSGYHPLFLAATCLGRVFQKPYFLGSIGLACGFLSGYLQKLPRIDDPRLIQFVRREQLRRLIGANSVWK